MGRKIITKIPHRAKESTEFFLGGRFGSLVSLVFDIDIIFFINYIKTLLVVLK